MGSQILGFLVGKTSYNTLQQEAIKDNSKTNYKAYEGDIKSNTLLYICLLKDLITHAVD